jgi:hypothetical protein
MDDVHALLLPCGAVHPTHDPILCIFLSSANPYYLMTFESAGGPPIRGEQHGEGEGGAANLQFSRTSPGAALGLTTSLLTHVSLESW